jgi:hypothetical protein
MAKMSYDVVPHDGGWAIIVTPARNGVFATRIDAFDAAVEFARKLRFVGYSVQVRVKRDKDELDAEPVARRA